MARITMQKLWFFGVLAAAWPTSNMQALTVSSETFICPVNLPSATSSYWEPPYIMVPKENGTGSVEFHPTVYTKNQDSFGDDPVTGYPAYFGWYEPDNGTDGYVDSSWFWENAETLWSCLGDASSFWLVTYTGTAMGHAIKWFGDDDPYPDDDVGSGDDVGNQSADQTDASYYSPGATLPSGDECYDYILYWTDSSGYHEQDLGNYCWTI